jgi:hypothetical protein
VCVVVAACVLIAGAAFRRLASSFEHWNGWPIAITNGCGYDLYADDGHDGLRMPAGETVTWERASRSGEKSIRVWSWLSALDHDNRPGLLVELNGDSVLSGERCPSLE